MSEYCPAGKIRCGHIDNYKTCCANIDKFRMSAGYFDVCPWPSKQKEIKETLADKVMKRIVLDFKCSNCPTVMEYSRQIEERLGRIDCTDCCPKVKELYPND